MVVFRKVSSQEPAVVYLAEVLRHQLSAGKQVFWLIAGGSAIDVAVQVSKQLQDVPLDKLTVSLTDERYGPTDDPDSNWQQLMQAGFRLAGAKLEPVLINKDLATTVEHFDQLLRKNLDSADFAVGQFGIGQDGHIGSLFPHFPQLHETTAFAAPVDDAPKPPPLRITLTPAAIATLDEAFACVVAGEAKWPQLDKLAIDVPIDEQPAQILKRVPKFTVYNDRKGDDI